MVSNVGFPKSIVSDQDRRGYWERIIVLLKPQYEQGAHRCGWKYGLIEVDLMATLAKEYSTLRDVDSRMTDYVVGKSIIRGLDLSLREEDVIKRNLGFSCFMEKLKRKFGKARNLGHPPNHSSLGKWEFIKGTYSSRNLSLSHI